MRLDRARLESLSDKYGDAFYILDSKQFIRNLCELESAFNKVYPKVGIAYSYKTNYTPFLAKIVNEYGGFAEVVSDMEAEVARRVGVSPKRIIWNGPYKNLEKVKELLLQGGVFNIDNVEEIAFLRRLSCDYPERFFRVGLRVNFPINDGVISRFGISTDTEEFNEALCLLKENRNLEFTELQLHFASRRLETWRPRARGLLELIERYNLRPDRIDLGGGLYGKMADELKEQFDAYIPTYEDYAEAAAKPIADYYRNKPMEECPMLLLEPGTALVGDCMSFVTRVVNIKSVRGKFIATVLGSVYNINPTLNGKNLPMTVHSMGKKQDMYSNLDFGGFTCIENDYVYRNYNGMLAVGDFLVFDNVGSYSITLKPPFILPNFPIIDIMNQSEIVVKRQEHFEDLFQTFLF